MTIGFPQLWGGTPIGQFEVGTDNVVVHSGRASAFIRATTSRVLTGQFGTLGQSMRADAYRGTRVRLSGWLRTVGVSGEGAGLWLRADGPESQPFDNMANRRIATASNWTSVSIVADIPQNAIGLAFGVLMVSPGIVWADDLQLEIVDSSIPVTAAALSIPASADTAAISATYDGIAMSPRNLDFEGVIQPAAVPETREWVLQNSLVFATDDPGVASSDLDPLRERIGNASIVALGEATHGTREFFRMKHRILAWLVREMGFSYFGIEATFPEALEVDHYVQTGEGDPKALLRGMYFWTWNTTEVLEMVEWMRAWNSAGNQPRVHFVGFDMQFPGLALDSVTAFAHRMSPTDGATVEAAYVCLQEHRSSVNPGTVLPQTYAQYPASDQLACRNRLKEVEALIGARETEWGERASLEKVRLVRRMAVLAIQWEENVTSPPASGVRDRSMADNVTWWHDTQAPGAKMVLWAHNQHIVRRRNWMGDFLSQRHGTAYLNIGQTFGLGSFNAVLLGIPTDGLPGQRIHSVVGYREESIEALFNTLAVPRLIFDTRKLRTEMTPATAPLSLPMAMRSIGASFAPTAPVTSFHSSLLLRNDYDLIVWFDRGTPSGLLPFTPPPQ
jgi:erythromycin esterase